MKNKFLSISPKQYSMFEGDRSKGRYRIYPKGRRFGATAASSFFFVKWMLEGKSNLFVDVIQSNIYRYVDRYFIPFMVSNKIPYRWQKQQQILTVGDGFTDFRSAEKPQSIEGQAYSGCIFLNEAGIILESEYLWFNSVLPMLIDYPDCQLIATGTPKTSQGRGLLFKKLYDKAKAGDKDYYAETVTTYDNPFLEVQAIKDLEMQIPAYERRQEIYGEFVNQGGQLVKLSWFGRYTAQPSQVERIVMSFDTASKNNEASDYTAGTVWLESNGYHYLIDVFCEKVLYPELKRTVWSMAEKYRPDQILLEDASSGMALIQDLENDRFPYNVLPIQPTKNKITRMGTASLSIESGRIFIPEHAAWLPEFEKQISVFPNKNEHDDICDSLSQYLNHIRSDSEIFIG